MGRFIPLSIPNFEGNESKYVNDALDQGWVSTGGAYITKLEQQMAEFLHTEEVAACQSGTAALHLALVECGVEPGDMVIVPMLTFIAAVNPVRYQFAEPVFMDCDDSLCMDPIKLKEFCELECTLKEDKLIHNASGKHVKAVVVVHVFGNLADMEAIMEIAEQYHLYVIEDATEALGTYYTKGRYAGKYAGTIGDFGAFSYNGNKIITTGGGGAITSNCPQKVKHIRYLSTQAKDDPHYYVHNEIGYNYRMTNLQAALGVAQMEELPEFIRRKNRNYDLYKQEFERSSEGACVHEQVTNENCECQIYNFTLGKLLDVREGTYSNRWFYAFEINREKVNASMREIITELEAKGVQTRAIWGLIHEQIPYKNAIAYKIEKAVYYSNCILNIPCSTQITEDEIRYVVEQVKIVLRALIK